MTEEQLELIDNKPLTQNQKFYRNHAEEQRARVREYRTQNLEKCKERSNEWKAKNKERVRLYNLQYRKTNAYLLYRKRYNKRHWQQNKERESAKHKQWYLGAKCYINFERRIIHAKAREALFHILGHVCAMCGHYDKRVLQFDHINGGGTKEHKTDFLNRRLHFYQFYVHNPNLAREKLQVLCANCNFLKRYQ